MKRILFLLVFLLSIIDIEAQNTPKYSDYSHWMDSLKTVYSVKKFVGLSQINYNYESNFGNLSVDEQNLLVDKIEDLYKQQEYLGLYYLAGFYLDRFYFFTSNQKIRERMIEIWYDKICYMSSEIINFGNSKYYTQHAKDRLLDIVEKRWNEDDIRAWTTLIKQAIDFESYNRDVKKIMNETNRQGKDIENYLLDSLINKRIEDNLQANINRPIYKQCILMIGSLNDQRFVPSLESMLEEYKGCKNYPEIQRSCIYALAKLGIQKYIDQVFENDKNINYGYLGTKEAFLKWLKINYVWQERSRLCSECGGNPRALVILYGIQNYLKNIPRELGIRAVDYEYFIEPKDYNNYEPAKDEKNRETVQKIFRLHQWIIDNKDKWEMPPASDSF